MSYTNNWTRVIRDLMEAKKTQEDADKKRDASGVAAAWRAHMHLGEIIRKAERHLHGTHDDLVDRAAHHDDSGRHEKATDLLHAARRTALAHLKKAISDHEKQHGSLDNE